MYLFGYSFPNSGHSSIFYFLSFFFVDGSLIKLLVTQIKIFSEIDKLLSI